MARQCFQPFKSVVSEFKRKRVDVIKDDKPGKIQIDDVRSIAYLDMGQIFRREPRQIRCRRESSRVKV